MSRDRHHVEIVTALSVRVAVVTLAAVIDQAKRQVRIVQRGETVAVNGEAAAIADARQMLAQRVRRFLPELTIVEGP